MFNGERSTAYTISPIATNSLLYGPGFGMLDVDHFLASVSDVGLKNWTMSDVGKYPFLGPINIPVIILISNDHTNIYGILP